MLTFVQNCFWILLMVLALGAAGGVVVQPFARALPFAVLVRPLAGLLLVVTGSLAMYVVLGLPLVTAGAATWGLCSLASLVVSRSNLIPETRADRFVLLGVVFCVVVLATTFATAPSILADEPSFVYLDWTDHLGYAHMADWLREHRVSVLPALDANRPYQSWPHFLVSHDPRFGSFTALALVSLVLELPGMFAYDTASALVLTTSLLGLAGVFARSRMGLVVLALGLFTCHWFDYTRTGFFAKAIAFPSSFFAAGLFMVAVRLRTTPWAIAALVALTTGAALMQSGTATALFLAVLGCVYLACLVVYSKSTQAALDSRPSLRGDPPNMVFHGAVLLLLLIGTAIVSSGTLARPVSPAFPDWNHTWDVILPRVFDLEAQTLPAAVMNPTQLKVALAISVCLWIALAVLAVLSRDAVSTALVVAPALLLLALRVADRRAMAFQMIGVFYPLALCGAATLVAAGKVSLGRVSRFSPRLALVVIGVAVFLHAPRLLNTGLRYSVEAPRERVFERGQMRELIAKIGPETVEVALGYDLHLCIGVLVELGRRGVELRWSPDSWRGAVGYRFWPAPDYSDQAPLTLIRHDAALSHDQLELFRTNQYKLVRNCRPGDSRQARTGTHELHTALHASVPLELDPGCPP